MVSVFETARPRSSGRLSGWFRSNAAWYATLTSLVEAEGEIDNTE